QGAERWGLERKVWRDGQHDPLPKGLAQLAAYLDRLGLTTGTLLLFDARSAAAPLPERVSREALEHGGRRITLLRL
ncbi:MAG: ATP-binding protein, partial [Thermoanaerobaculia bacterium]|nr:ATP-binding protein [Thermoanaerobaculia bacterium]